MAHSLPPLPAQDRAIAAGGSRLDLRQFPLDAPEGKSRGPSTRLDAIFMRMAANLPTSLCADSYDFVIFEGGHLMDVVYLALVGVFWLLLAGMSVGCAKLEGPAQ